MMKTLSHSDALTLSRKGQAALGKLLANWRTLMESSAIPLFELR